MIIILLEKSWSFSLKCQAFDAKVIFSKTLTFETFEHITTHIATIVYSEINNHFNIYKIYSVAEHLYL